MDSIFAIISVPRQLASLIALVGIAIVICSFLVAQAPVDSKWRRLAFAFLTLAGCGICWLGAWLAFRAA